MDRYWVSRKTGDPSAWFFEVPNQTGPTLTVTQDLAGQDVRCGFSVRNSGGSAEFISAPVSVT